MKELHSILLIFALTIASGLMLDSQGNTDYGFVLGFAIATAYIIGKWTKNNYRD